MTESQINVRERRANFYKWAEDDLGLSRSEVVKILLNHGYESLKESEITTYKAALKLFIDKRDGITEKMAQIAAEREIAKQKRKCWVPGCDGERVYQRRGWGWNCSIGGSRHYIARKTAVLREKKREWDDGANPDTFDERVDKYTLHILEEMARYDKEKEKKAEGSKVKESPTSDTHSEEGDDEIRDSAEPSETADNGESDKEREK